LNLSEENFMQGNRLLRTNATIFVILFLISSLALAQTPIQAPKNPFPLSEDVKLGQQAAREAERQFPLLNVPQIDAYVERIGERLVAAAPAQFQHPEFHFTYKVVNVKDLNAFALPGGYTYVNRGLIEAAKSEGQLAGVMAHEISHVLLRHGTAQYAKAQKVGIWAGLAAIGGAIVGGQAGATLAQSAFGVYFLKYSREYERQADLLGARIMANAGYNPRDLAEVFRMLEREGGSNGPEFLSDHPNPGNRYDYIIREAQALRIADVRNDNSAFYRVQSQLRDFPYSKAGNSRRASGTGTGTRRGEAPSRYFQDFTSSDGSLRLKYPENWQAYTADRNSLTFAPSWAVEGGEITHGVIIGAQNSRRNLNQSLDDLINSLRQSNSYLRETDRQRYQIEIDGRAALGTYLYGRNSSGNAEQIACVVTSSGNQVLYILSLAPDREYSQYSPTFEKILSSINIRQD
jgi:predicted Zn-dependent protease